MNENGYSLADIASVANNEGFGGGGGIWLFALLILLFGSNGWNNRGCEQYATSADVQRGFDTNAIEQQIRGVTYGLSDLGLALNNSIEGAKDYVVASVGNVKDAVVCEGRSLQSQISMLNANIDNKFAQMQKEQLEQKINEQAQTINQLQIAQQFCGVPKISNVGWGIYQTATPTGCGCNCGNI